MSIAQFHRKSVKKRKKWWVWLLQIFIIAIFVAVFVITLIEALKMQLFSLLVEALSVDTKFLVLLSGNVFIVGGALLVLIYQWAERDNIRFRSRQKRYRSMLVCKDYYQSIRRVKIDQFMVTPAREMTQRRLQVDHDLKTSDFVTLDRDHIVNEARQTHITFKNGRLDGVFKTYFSNGNILAEISYREGMLDGRCVIYYPNGSLHNEKHFKRGRLDGDFRAWDEDGALFFEIEYLDDIQHGLDRSYRKNGIIEYEDLYVHGKMVRRKTFDELGQFKYEQKYIDDEKKDGQKDGVNSEKSIRK